MGQNVDGRGLIEFKILYRVKNSIARGMGGRECVLFIGTQCSTGYASQRPRGVRWVGLQKLITVLDMRNSYKGGVHILTSRGREGR